MGLLCSVAEWQVGKHTSSMLTARPKRCQALGPHPRPLGAVCDATERLVRGEDTRALRLGRPPAFGTPREDCLRVFGHRLDRFDAKIRPELVFVRAGFDARAKTRWRL